MKKWANVRDSFMRSLRCGTGQAAKKIYMYSDHLQFLLKTGKQGETVNNYNDDHGNDGEEDEDGNLTDLVNLTEPVTSPGMSAPQKQVHIKNTNSRKRPLDPVEREIMREIKDVNMQKITTPPSDHELVISSFLPHIRDMNSSELLDFQMQTLTVIQAIKNKRVSHGGYQCNPSPSTSDGNNSSSSYRRPQPSPLQAQYIELQPALPAVQYTGQQPRHGSANAFQSFLDQCSNEQD